MIAFHADIRQVHVAAVMASGTLFALRAMALLAGLRWPRLAPVRYLGYTLDTVLLTAALMLWTILPRELFANGWLWAKLALVTAYVVVGILAFRPQRRSVARAGLIVLAGMCFLQAYFIARAHHPLGAIALFAG